MNSYINLYHLTYYNCPKYSQHILNQWRILRYHEIFCFLFTFEWDFWVSYSYSRCSYSEFWNFLTSENIEDLWNFGTISKLMRRVIATFRQRQVKEFNCSSSLHFTVKYCLSLKDRKEKKIVDYIISCKLWNSIACAALPS